MGLYVSDFIGTKIIQSSPFGGKDVGILMYRHNSPLKLVELFSILIIPIYPEPPLSITCP